MNKSYYDKYYKKGGTYVVPIEIFNELFDELERLSFNYEQALEDLDKKDNIIKELEEYLIEQVEKSYSNDYDNILDKLDELKGNNEPSFEEMVGFVENVYKDIKNQSTLHEELEEERKTIAKIVGDFKEVINNE